MNSSAPVIRESTWADSTRRLRSWGRHSSRGVWAQYMPKFQSRGRASSEASCSKTVQWIPCCQVSAQGGARGWHSRPFSGFGQRAAPQDLSTANQLGEDVDLRRQTSANDYDTESVDLFAHTGESEVQDPRRQRNVCESRFGHQKRRNSSPRPCLCLGFRQTEARITIIMAR
jgi:hypothetical protein